MNKRWGLVLTGLLMIALGVSLPRIFASVGTASGDRSGNVRVPGMGSAQLTMQLYKGASIAGEMTIRNGNESVQFQIKDPFGNVIRQPQLVKSYASFSVSAQADGAYTLYLQNTGLLDGGTTPKDVYIMWQSVKIALPGIGQAHFIIVGIGVICVCIGVFEVSGPRRRDS